MFDPDRKNWTRVSAHYPDAIRFRTPRGFRDQLKRAAEAEHVPVSELIRRAIVERIERVSQSGEASMHEAA